MVILFNELFFSTIRISVPGGAADPCGQPPEQVRKGVGWPQQKEEKGLEAKGSWTLWKIGPLGNFQSKTVLYIFYSLFELVYQTLIKTFRKKSISLNIFCKEKGFEYRWIWSNILDTEMDIWSVCWNFASPSHFLYLGRALPTQVVTKGMCALIL